MGEATQAREAHVLRHRPVQDERLRLAVLRCQPEPGGDGRAWVRGELAPVEPDLALIGHVEPVDQVQQLGAARADQPAQAEHLPGVQLQRRAPHGGQPPDRADVQQDLVGCHRSLGVELVDLVPDHQLHELLGGRGRRYAGRGGPAVGEHGDATPDAPDLVEPVRDVHHAHAVVGEAANHVEERLDLALVEDRGRLIHDQQPRVDGQGPRDRDDLLRGRPQRPHLRPRGDRLMAEPRQQRARHAAHLVEVEQRPATRLVGQEDALRDRQVLDQIELLIDRRDPAFERLGRVADRQGSPMNRISPLVGSCTPEMHLISVDLPAPLGPSRQCTSPPTTSKLTPWRASTPGNSLTTSRTSRTDWPDPSGPAARSGPIRGCGDARRLRPAVGGRGRCRSW